MHGNRLMALILLILAAVFLLIAAIPDASGRISWANLGFACAAAAAASLVWG